MSFTKITGPGIHTLSNIMSHNVKSSGIITAVNGNLTGWLAVGSTASFGGNVSIGGTLTYDDVTNVESVGIITAKEGIHVGAGGTIIHALSEDDGKVGIGTDNPNAKLNIYSSDPGVITPDVDADELVLENGGNVGLSLLTAGTGESSIYFGNPGTDGQKEAWIKYYHETHAITGNRRALTFKAGGGTEKMRLTSTSILGVGITTPNQESGNGIHIGGVGNNGQARLHLTTAASGHTTTDGFYIVGLGNESSGSEGDVLLQNKEDANMLFSTNDTERLRITSSGITSSRSPSDATPNFKFRSDDVNWQRVNLFS
jgi:hypothetical protein